MKNTLRLLLAILTFSSAPLMAEEEASNRCEYQLPANYCYEDNNYLYRWNVSFNPVGWVFGYYCGASVAYALNNNIAVRGDIGATISDSSRHCNGDVELTIGLPIYFCSVYNGLFIEPQISVNSCSDGTSLGAVVGWHWMWDSGWNVSAALGVGHNFNRCGRNSGLRGYLQVGYNF